MAAVISLNPIATPEPAAAIHATAMDSSNTSSATSAASGASSATISANDFLTLLVTEMKNQDPTATTDPNEYINQLVNVNSLEQLININQTLTSAYGSSSTYSASGAATQSPIRPQVTIPQNESASNLSALHSGTQSAASATSSSVMPQALAGNLSVPANNPSAERLAQSLDGNSHLLPFTSSFAIR